MLQIALHIRRAQQFLDALGLGKAVVHPKTDIRRKFKIDSVRDFRTQKFLVPLEGGDNFFGVATSERHHVNGGKPQVGAHAYFRNRDHVSFDDWIMHVTTGEHFGERMPHQFTNTQLPLRAAR